MRTLRKVLVANRGEIARRVFRTCREMGLSTVAVFSEADRDAPFVGEADEAVALGGASPAESYLRLDAIVAAALRTGADAIHPGYGFLSESPALPRACADAGIVFVGPGAAAMEALGGKIAAKRLAAQAGVPVLPWAEVGADGALSARLAWPVLVKASAGGGGRGMRVVSDPADLAAAVEACRREAEAAFGDPTVFVESFLEGARHVEVQVVADTHGRVVSLFERECSVQRRWQKVIEEAPSPAVGHALRGRLSEAAIALATAAGYVGAGTMEFLLSADAFHFLEANTRLQVEHPVTEAVTGLDLVRLQLLVAMGEPLGREAASATLRGHAIEARLYAEDPTRDFAPSIGRVHRFRAPAPSGVRVDAGVEDGSEVGVHYDALLAKVIAHAPTRAEAASRLAGALTAQRVHGVDTNRDLLVRVLRDAAFREGAVDTGYLERRADLRAPLADEATDALHAVAAALAAAAARRADARVLGFAPSGFRNNPAGPQEVEMETGRGRHRVAYAFDRDGVTASVDGMALDALRLGACRADLVDLEVAGVRRRYEVHEVDGVHHVDSVLGSTVLREVERLPVPRAAERAGSLRSPLPGRVARLAVTPGAAVTVGQLVAVVEAMKMEHRVTAPAEGRVAELCVAEGQQVDAGAVLAVVEPLDRPT